MRPDKSIIFQLRKEGKSYRQIQEETGVSRSTLCDWFHNEEWSKHLKHKNTSLNTKISTERLARLNNDRLKRLLLEYEKAEKEASVQFDYFKKDPLFMAGLMIYAGEGDKRSRNISRITNTEYYLHKIFIKFSEKYLYIPRESIKLALIIYPDNDMDACINSWSKELSIKKENFHKTQIIQGKEKTKRLQNGIAISIISNTVIVKKKILMWLKLASSMEL